MRLKTTVQTLIADTITPVVAYLRLRDRFPGCLLLESADYQPGKNALSFLCVDPISTFQVLGGVISVDDRGKLATETAITERSQVRNALKEFVSRFSVEADQPLPFENGVFGYCSYDAVRYFEDIELSQVSQPERPIPDICYQAFRYIFVFNHYKNELTLIENTVLESEHSPDITSEQLLYLLFHSDYPLYRFRREGKQQSNFTEDQYLEVIQKCKDSIQRGDVFQIVPSRRYTQAYSGDDFSVYRALRSINPSPYLFYFDYGSFRIFGSSPEAQLVVEKDVASLYPIAGTYRRTLDEDRDKRAVEALLQDEKENAEHVMLVDLARNDLSRHCFPVEVKSYKEVQTYSHVIHLTSQVDGKLEKNVSPIDLLADTFPMGTLSGAPKYRAMELLDSFEVGPRRSYGGAIGMLGFNGSVNHAIIIRSFYSEDQVLTFQAGGGVVADSKPEDEVQEVRNKLAALQQALVIAEEFSR